MHCHKDRPGVVQGQGNDWFNQILLCAAEVTLLDVDICMREIIYHSHIRPKVGLWAGQQRYGGLVLRGKRFFFFPNTEAGCGAHPSSCLMGSIGSMAPSQGSEAGWPHFCL